jgi:ATP-dependent RNA helicase DBP3
VYGGVSKEGQISALRQGVEIVVATPGRLLDLVNDRALDLSHVQYLVLDEADRMLDMGFEKDIRAIVKMLHAQRQTLMFSATWPEVIQKLAHDFLSKPVKVTIGSADLSANKSVKQIIEVLDGQAKDARLLDLLRQYHSSKANRVIIFALYKKKAIRLEEFLNRKGYKAQGLHADKKQWERTQALEQFKDGSKPLLVATDVAARGLDIPNVEYVINYTFPLTIEDYVHRIGRTGRAGKTVRYDPILLHSFLFEALDDHTDPEAYS